MKILLLRTCTVSILQLFSNSPLAISEFPSSILILDFFSSSYVALFGCYTDLACTDYLCYTWTFCSPCFDILLTNSCPEIFPKSYHQSLSSVTGFSAKKLYSYLLLQYTHLIFCLHNSIYNLSSTIWGL